MNPYEASTVHPHSAASQPRTVNVVVFVLSGISLLNGLGVLFLLTTEVFAQALVFMGCLAISAACWTYLAICASQRWKRSARLVVMLHVAVLLITAVDLPRRQARQDKLRQTIERIKAQAEYRR